MQACGWSPPMYWCSSVGSPDANQTSEEACSKANLKTTKKKKKGKWEAEFLFRFATEEKECKTVAVVDIFSAR